MEETKRRPGPRGEGRSFSSLKETPSHAELRKKMVIGVSPTRLADWLHERGEMTNFKRASLVAFLCAYRRSISARELIAAREPGYIVDAKKKMDGAINEVDEIAAMYNVQKDRILQGRKTEENLMVLNQSLGNEVRIAGELLRTSMTIKQQMGMADPDAVNTDEVPPVHRYDNRSRYGERVARVIEDPASRNRVLNTVQALVDAARGQVEEESEDD